jgi:hypothetical protein
MVFIAAGFFCLLSRSSAWCATVSGSVVDSSGKDVVAVKITVTDPATGKVVGQAVTHASGKYQIAGIDPGTYNFALDPGTTGVKPGSATAALPGHGLSVDWTVSPTADAIALATPAGAGGVVTGTGTAVAAGVGAALVAGGVLGGLAASGEFSGGGGPQPIQSASF